MTLKRRLRRIKDFGSTVVASIGPKRKNRLAFFPSSDTTSSGKLRCENIATEMGHLDWKCLVVPASLGRTERRIVLAIFRPSFCILQTGRHPLNRRDVFRGYRYIVDQDDADFHLPRFADSFADLCKGADGIICGSRYIQDNTAKYSLPSSVVWTAAYPSQTADERQVKRLPIIVWAQTKPENYGLELEMVMKVMESISSSVEPGPTLRVYGMAPDTLQAASSRLAKCGVTIENVQPTSYDKFVDSLRDCSIGLCPLSDDNPFSRGKSFGKILAYLDAGVPTVSSNIADHGQVFDGTNGLVVSTDDEWRDVTLRLLKDQTLRESIAQRGYDSFQTVFAPQQAASKYDAFVKDLMKNQPGMTMHPGAGSSDESNIGDRNG